MLGIHRIYFLLITFFVFAIISGFNIFESNHLHVFYCFLGIKNVMRIREKDVDPNRLPHIPPLLPKNLVLLFQEGQAMAAMVRRDSRLCKLLSRAL